MDVLEAIGSRVTTPPVKMCEPGPGAAELELMFKAAAAAPDHGKLRPWRFIVVRGKAREKLGELFAQGVLEGDPGATPAMLDKQREAPMRAPVILVAVARCDEEHPKIPVWEQEAATACAVQNLLLAAHGLGYASKWASGANAASRTVARGLGLVDNERIRAIIYLGTAATRQALPPRPDPETFVSEWNG